MSNTYMTINDEQRKRLAEWKATNANNPAFQDLMDATAQAHEALTKLAANFPRGSAQ